MVTVHDVQQGSPEWDRIREGRYTGANADKLLSGGSSIKIVNGVVMGYGQNEVNTFKGNFHTKRGHILEEQAIQLYERLFGGSVPRPGFITNDRFSHCGYSPDGYPTDRNLEVKAFEKAKHLKLYHGDIPLKVLAQIYFGLVISEKKIGELIPYNPDFSKKEIDGVLNPDYDPKLAFKVIPLELTYSIRKHFEHKLMEAFV